MPVPSPDLSATATTTRSVLIAVLTYRRPDDLAELLPELNRQLEELRPDGPWRADILVVDNDPGGSGRQVCAELGLDRLRYVHEPEPGIAAARNRALDEAAGHDLLIFIDDDERPSEHWLALLLGTFAGARSVGVVGPVVSRFRVPLPEWVAAGRFFDRRRMPTGRTVTVAATNNLLLDLNRLRGTGVRFDQRFGLTGGSDTLFVRQLVQAEGPLVWCDEAVVTDVVPAERCTRDWVLRRALRMGNSWSLTSLALERSGPGRLRTRLALTGSGLTRLAGGTALVGLGLAAGNLGRRARGVRTLARGAGMLMGAYGLRYVEYRRGSRASSPG